MARPADNSPAAWEVQLAVLRGMSGSERVAKAFEMSEAARAVTEAGIRHRHPEWSDEQVWDALMNLLLGEELARAARESRQTPA